MTRYELEQRLIRFSLDVLVLKKYLNGTFESDYLIKQLIRSSMSASLNYAESVDAESKKDYIHKYSIAMKELRESNVNIKTIIGAGLSNNQQLIEKILDESNQLCAIFHSGLKKLKGIKK